MLTGSSWQKLLGALLRKGLGGTSERRRRTRRKDGLRFRPDLEMLEKRLNPSNTLGTLALVEAPASGTDSDIVVATGSWSATANALWLHTTASGTNNGLAMFSFDANSGATRSGTLTIAGLTLTVTQAGSTYVAANPVTALVASGLNTPGGVAVDSSGNVYIADTYNNAIKEWNASTQTVTTLVSTGLSEPEAVAVDSSGNVYIADTLHGMIKEWNAGTHQVSTLVSTGLFDPEGVAVDSSGNVYIADTFNDAIKEWNVGTQAVSTLISGLNKPYDVAVDVSGNVYFADWGNNAIKEWSPATGFTTTLVSSGLLHPTSVAVDGSGNVYFADQSHDAIKEWSATTHQVNTLVSGLNLPEGVAVDGVGNVYIADTYNNAIKELPRAFVPAGAITESPAAGSDQLLPVLPASEVLTGVFAPSSDQSWLTLDSPSGGVIPFSFPANTGTTSLTAHITVLGQQITVTQLASTTTTLTDNGPNPSNAFDTVSFVVTVSPSVPDGETVTLEDASNGNAVVGTGTLAGGTATISISTLGGGTHNLFAVYGGDANYAASQSDQVAQTVNFLSTSTTLTDNGPNPSYALSAVSFVATVSPTVPDGETVTLEDASNGNAVVGTGTLTGGTVTISVSTLTVGTHNIFAVYGGDPDYLPSQSDQVAQTVNLVPTSTTLTDNGPNPSNPGDSVNFVVLVSPSVPDGETVTLEDASNGNAVVGTGTLAGGTVTISVSTLTSGTHNLFAVYGGDANYAASQSDQVAQTVTLSTSISLTDNGPNPSFVGDTVSFGVTISPTVPDNETVTLEDASNGNAVVGTGTLTGGTVTISLSTLTGGTHNLFAVYGGDPAYAPSQSAQVTQTVNFWPTSTTLTDNGPNPSNVGDTVSFVVTVSPSVPDGETVALEDASNGNAVVATGTLAGGTVTISVSTLTGGTHNLFAVYSGDATYAPSQSDQVAQTVNFLPTNTTLTDNGPNPSNVGDAVSFVVTVNPSVPDGETVALEDANNGNAVVGTGTLAGGTVTISVSTLTAGTHNIFAVYGGDATYAPSQSDQVAQTVNLVPTNTTLTDNGPNPSNPGDAVSFVVTVSPSAPDGETVTLEDANNGNAVVGTGSLAGGTVTISVSSLTSGGHNIFAVYGGDTTYAASQSAAVSQAVRFSTSISLTDNGPNPSNVGDTVGFVVTVSPAVPDGETVTLEDASNSNAVVGTGSLTGGTVTISVSTLTAGTHDIFAVYGGDDTYAASQSSQVAQTVNLLSSNTTLTDNGPNPSNVGDAVSFVVTVNPAVPDGETVTLEDASNGNAVVGTGSLTGGTVTISVSTLTAGTHNLFAVYGGDATYAASQSVTVAQTVNLVSTNTTLADNGPNPSTLGDAVSFVVTVSPTVPDGETVTLEDASNSNAVVGTGSLTGGTVTISLSTLTAGTHDIFAVYSGDATYAASQSVTVAQTVHLLPTNTTLTDNGPNPSNIGDTVSFVVTVSPTVPDGETVTLEDASNSNAVVATGSLTGGTVTFSVSTLSGGVHNIFAVYGGDATYAASQSATVAQTVNLLSTSTTLTDNGPNPSSIGDTVSFVVTVSPTVPDGETVTLEDASNSNAVVATGSLTGGTVTFSVSTLSGGVHNIFAVYGGDATYAASQSATVAQTVNLLSTSTTLTDNGPNPSNTGDAVSFVVTVSPTVPDGETVTLEDASNGNAVVGTGTLTGGTVTISVSTLTAGTHNIFAVYGGDDTYAASQSAQVAQVVNNSGPAPAFSSATVNGANVTISGQSVSLAGKQRSMVDNIVFTFNEAVTLDPGAFTIALHSGVSVNGGPAGTVGTLPTLNWTSPDGGLTWVVTFSGAGVVGGSIADGDYDITVVSTAVHANGQTMSSNVTNTFYRLFGDTNGAGQVSGRPDLVAMTGTLGKSIGQAGYLAYLDYNADGIIAGRPDFSNLTSRLGTVYTDLSTTI